MIDFGFDKIALIGAVALIVIGPEKLPRVARTVGHLVGKAQRYVADVKAEVNRSIELEELKKMKTEFETAARDVEQTVQNVSSQIHQTGAELEQSWQGSTGLPANSGLGPPTSNGRLSATGVMDLIVTPLYPFTPHPSRACHQPST